MSDLGPATPHSGATADLRPPPRLAPLSRESRGKKRSTRKKKADRVLPMEREERDGRGGDGTIYLLATLTYAHIDKNYKAVSRMAGICVHGK